MQNTCVEIFFQAYMHFFRWFIRQCHKLLFIGINKWFCEKDIDHQPYSLASSVLL